MIYIICELFLQTNFIPFLLDCLLVPLVSLYIQFYFRAVVVVCFREWCPVIVIVNYITVIVNPIPLIPSIMISRRMRSNFFKSKVRASSALLTADTTYPSMSRYACSHDRRASSSSTISMLYLSIIYSLQIKNGTKSNLVPFLVRIIKPTLIFQRFSM